MPAADVPIVLALEARFGYSLGSSVDASAGTLQMFGGRGVFEISGCGSIPAGLEGTLRDTDDFFGGNDDLRTLPFTYDSDKQRFRPLDSAA